jgi:two-component system, cell cycle response regulator DivK
MTKILVVEDNEVNQRIILRRLERRGFEVVVAGDGKQGVDLAASELPDLILMDMSLPILDGWEATRRIKASQASGHIPIIALTAHAMVGDREQALDAGCDDYDVKPIDIDRLTGKIDAQLARAASSSGTP